MKHKTADTLEMVVHLVELTGYDQEHWVNGQAYGAADWQSLISLSAAYNRHLSDIIRRIPEETLHNESELAPGKGLSLDYLVKDYISAIWSTICSRLAFVQPCR